VDTRPSGGCLYVFVKPLRLFAAPQRWARRRTPSRARCAPKATRRVQVPRVRGALWAGLAFPSIAAGDRGASSW